MIGKYARFKHPGLVENFDHPIRMVDKRVWGKLMLNFFVGSAPMLKYSDWLMIFFVFFVAFQVLTVKCSLSCTFLNVL